MLRLGQKGVGTTELIVSLIFLLIMGIYAWKILERQKVAVLTSNQNIEIVDLVNSIRKVLAQPQSCSATFNDLLPNVDPGEIDSIIEVSSAGTKEEKFILSDYSDSRYGQHGLRIDSYELSKDGLNKDPFAQGTYLIITFGRGFHGKTTKREIKLFTEDNDGRISNCALGFTNTKSKIWEINPQGDVTTRFKVIIGLGDDKKKEEWNVMVNGGIQFFPTEQACTPALNGNIFSTKTGLKFCDNGLAQNIFEYGGIY